MDIDMLTILNTPLIFQGRKQIRNQPVNLSSLFSENRNLNFNVIQKNVL